MFSLKLYITLHCQSNVLDLAAGAYVGKTCRPRNTRREPASHLCVQPMWFKRLFLKQSKDHRKSQKLGDGNIVVLWFYWENAEAQNGCSLWMKRLWFLKRSFICFTLNQTTKIARMKIAITLNKRENGKRKQKRKLSSIPMYLNDREKQVEIVCNV